MQTELTDIETKLAAFLLGKEIPREAGQLAKLVMRLDSPVWRLEDRCDNCGKKTVGHCRGCDNDD